MPQTIFLVQVQQSSEDCAQVRQEGEGLNKKAGSPFPPAPAPPAHLAPHAPFASHAPLAPHAPLAAAPPPSHTPIDATFPVPIADKFLPEAPDPSCKQVGEREEAGQGGELLLMFITNNVSGCVPTPLTFRLRAAKRSRRSAESRLPG